MAAWLHGCMAPWLLGRMAVWLFGCHQPKLGRMLVASSIWLNSRIFIKDPDKLAKPECHKGVSMAPF